MQRTRESSGFRVLLLVSAMLIVFEGMCSTSWAQTSEPATTNSSKKWSLQLEEVDAPEVSLDPAFKAAIYENLLTELGKTAEFEQVFRSGDHSANGEPYLLILKITVRKFDPGSETKRAVTTFAGATKIKVESQLETRDGKLVKDDLVEGDVHFFGSNLRATHNLARNVANVIKKSTLPEPNARVSRNSDLFAPGGTPWRNSLSCDSDRCA